MSIIQNMYYHNLYFVGAVFMSCVYNLFNIPNAALSARKQNKSEAILQPNDTCPKYSNYYLQWQHTN